jgi:HAD superfamily hydrolase (TIGR01509 family)
VTTGLLVAGGGFQGLPMLRALRELGARVVVADSYAQNPNRYQADVYAVVPPVAQRASFDSAILDLCREHRVDIVFSTTAHDALALAALAPRLRSAGMVVAVASHELLAAWTDKATCLGELAGAGLPVLPIVDPEREPRGLPLIGKPRRGFGSRDIVAARTAAELASALAADTAQRLFWQPLLEAFTEWSIDFAVDEQGRVSPLVVRERLRSSGGFAVVSRVRHAAPVAATAAAAARVIAGRGACGNVNLQILVDADGAEWLNDVNLRPGTSSTAALGDNINFAAFMLGNPVGSARKHDFLHVRTLHDLFLPLPATDSVAGVAFDLDDCVIDHKRWLDDKLSLVVEDLGVFADERQRDAFAREARRVVDEGPWDRLIDVALHRSGLDAALAAGLIARWRAVHPASVAVHPDAAAAMRRLRAAGIKLAIVTDNPAASQRQKLARLPPELRPDAVVLTDEEGAPKPAAAGYRKAAELLGLEPHRMAAVGDSPWRDAIGALDAGYSAAIVAPRQGAMGNPDPGRFRDSHPLHAARIHWIADLWALPEVLLGERSRAAS